MNNNSYAQIVEKYSTLLRKTSMIHPRVLEIHGEEINRLLKSTDKLIADIEGSASKAEKIFELRRLIYQIEYIVNFKVIDSYNSIIDRMVTAPQANTGTVKSESKNNEEPVFSLEDNSQENIKGPRDAWDSVCNYLKGKLNVHTYNVWVKPVKYHSCDNRMIKILVQNNYYKNWLEEHCLSIINEHLSRNNTDYEVRFITG